MMTSSKPDSVHVESPTEERNPRTVDIDTLPTLEILRLINAEDRTVPAAVSEALGDLAVAVDLAVACLRAGGRVHYVGAGTSGRLATLDAAELGPTFNLANDLFLTHHAGGITAFRTPAENAEDNGEAGALAIRQHAGEHDFVLGLSASGRTPYVLGALAAAREIGAKTALVSGNPAIIGQVEADALITVNTGPEAIAGSTRMKAGTAQKLVLTSFSTTVLVRLGQTYSNLMVSVRATNAKLRGRMVRILVEATGLSEAVCADAATAADGDLKVALVHLLSGTDIERSAMALRAADGRVRAALDTLRDTGPA